MSEQDDRESKKAEVRPAEDPVQGAVEEVVRVPGLFTELGTGITTRDVVIPSGEEPEERGPEQEAESGAEPSPPVVTGRRKGGPLRQKVEAEPQPGVEGETLSGEQRLLILDAWTRSGLTAGEFGRIAGISPHTLYAWRKRFRSWGRRGWTRSDEERPRAAGCRRRRSGRS